MSTITISGDLLQQVNLAPEDLVPHMAEKAIRSLAVEESTDQEWSPAAFVEAACGDLKPRILTAGGQQHQGVWHNEYRRRADDDKGSVGSNRSPQLSERRRYGECY